VSCLLRDTARTQDSGRRWWAGAIWLLFPNSMLGKLFDSFGDTKSCKPRFVLCNLLQSFLLVLGELMRHTA
jgi:hypothetical protein